VSITFPDNLDQDTVRAALKVTLRSSSPKCAKGARVVVRSEGKLVRRGTTNPAGVFAFSVKRPTGIGAVAMYNAVAPGGPGCHPSPVATATVAGSFNPPG
jgi:hypothetical protein